MEQTQHKQKKGWSTDWVVLRYHFAHSNYVSVIWNWFLELSGKLAAPILLASVLFAGLKLAQPNFTTRYLGWFDVFITVASLLALDMGGLGLRAIAKQAREQGNEQGANNANRVALCMFSLMMITLALSSVSSAMHWPEVNYAWVIGLLLIVRAVLSVLYGILIHDLSAEKANYAVIKSSDVRERLDQFTEMLQRTEGANKETMRLFGEALQRVSTNTENHLQIAHAAIRSLSENTDYRIGILAENIAANGSNTENRIAMLHGQFQSSLAETEHRLEVNTEGHVLALAQSVANSLMPVVNELQEQSETLQVLSELSTQFGQFEESTRTGWRTITEEVKVTIAQQMEVLPKATNRVVEQTPNTKRIVAPKGRTAEKPKGKDFDKKAFICECLRENSAMSIGDIQRRALAQGQKIVGSYVSETRTAFLAEQKAVQAMTEESQTVTV